MAEINQHKREGGDQNLARSSVKNFLLVFVGLAIGILLGYQFSGKSPEPWKPVLETSNFDYMDDVANAALTKMDEAYNNGNVARILKSNTAIRQVEQSLFKLKYYYLPITKVRQLVYDADRLFYLNQRTQANQKLENAKKLLEAAAESDVISLQKPLSELIAMIDDLIISLGKESPEISEKFGEIGHRVNMMAYKGELIISEVKIPEKN